MTVWTTKVVPTTMAAITMPSESTRCSTRKAVKTASVSEPSSP